MPVDGEHEYSAECQCPRCRSAKAAYDAYWAARNHEEEHRAVQRIMALNPSGRGGWNAPPCQEPDCIALRAEERRKAGLPPEMTKEQMAEAHKRVCQLAGGEPPAAVFLWESKDSVDFIEGNNIENSLFDEDDYRMWELRNVVRGF